MQNLSSITLTLPLMGKLLSFLQRTVEEASLAWNLDEKGALRLTLGAEEMYTFLLAQGKTHEFPKIEVTISDEGAWVELRFLLPREILPLEAFNLVPGERALPGHAQGLFLAARMVSFLRVEPKEHNLEISLCENRSYPLGKAISEEVPSSGPWRMCAPEAPEAQQLADRTAARSPEERPSFVLRRGMAADLLRSPFWGAQVALDSQNRVGAGLFWERRGKMAFFHGPWNFSSSPTLGEELLNATLGELYGQHFEGVILLDPPRETPRHRFEILGKLPRKGGSSQEALYCSLREDTGGPIYLHASLEEPLRKMAERLCLPRELRSSEPPLHRIPEASALGVRTDLPRKEAYLFCLAPGRDGRENVLSHLKILRSQGMEDIFFLLDLGQFEDLPMGGFLMEAGFLPRLLLPWAGRGDLLLWTAPEA